MSRTEYELFTNLCEVCRVILQSMLFLAIWNIFYRPQRNRKAVDAAGVFVAANMVQHLCPAVPAWARFVASAVTVLGYCCIRYKKHLENVVFTMLLFYNFHCMSFLVSSSIYQYLMEGMPGRLDAGSADYMFQAYKGMAIGLGLNLLFYILFFVLVAGIVKKIVKSPFTMNWNEAMFLSALNIVGSMLAWIVVDISVVQIDKEVFSLFAQRREMIWKIPMIAVLICAGEISAIYIFQNYKELQGEKEKHFVEEQQMKAMKRRLEEAENFYGSIRKAKHEMKSHMVNIKGLVAEEKYGEVVKYIGKLDETIQELDYKFNTGNAVTDVIINDKYQRAVKSGIVFRAKFDYRETDTISAFDMGIVLNNLLDNAIEACEKLEKKKRRITLTLKRRNHFLLVEVENSFDGRLEWEDGDLIPMTMKQSILPDILMEHGIGLKNVKDVADRYLGDMDIKAGRDTFKVIVMLQQKEIQ